jgi:hypothetical protein
MAEVFMRSLRSVEKNLNVSTLPEISKRVRRHSSRCRDPAINEAFMPPPAGATSGTALDSGEL